MAMNLLLSERALRDYQDLPPTLQKAVNKQFAINIWQARISKDWRFYFRIDYDRYSIITIIKHPK